MNNSQQFLVPLSSLGLKKCFKTKDNHAFKIKNIRQESRYGKRKCVYECMDTDGDITEMQEDIEVYPLFNEEFDYLMNG